jgi:hypothetical protein
MDEDDDLIGPPVPLSHKRRREAEEDDETLERLAKRPALGQEANGVAATPGVTPMEAESTVQPEPSRSKKRQLRVKLGDTPLAVQPPDVKVGDKG